MDRWEEDGLRSANHGLRNQVDHILDTFEQHQTQLNAVRRQLETLRVQAGSPDQLVQVTVDARGVLAEVTLTAAALRRTPEDLGRSITETAQAAALSAQQQSEALLAPITAEFDGAAALSDIVEEASSLRDIRTRIDASNPTADRTGAQLVDTEAET
ncbi:YbaB/EbfC family nucleoid-associated protein [Nocardia nepalensis]|uniref:YbaB/EbfC family nucleoid-associated protein n=1 Tax=Nocardia nepalensis TaxID=3375448 RepID=UPI003B670E60